MAGGQHTDLEEREHLDLLCSLASNSASPQHTPLTGGAACGLCYGLQRPREGRAVRAVSSGSAAAPKQSSTLAQGPSQRSTSRAHPTSADALATAFATAEAAARNSAGTTGGQLYLG